MTMVYLTLLGLIPCLMIGLLIYKIFVGQAYRKMSFISFLFGVISTYPAIKMEQFAIYDLGLSFDRSYAFSTFTFAFAVIAFSEEVVKYIFLRYAIIPKLIQVRFTTIVAFSVLISLGFATIENIMYITGYHTEPSSALQLALIRMLTALPAHLMFGLVMGISIAIGQLQMMRKTLWSAFGLALAIILHGMFDYLIFMRMGYALLIFAGIVVLLLVSSLIVYKTAQINDAIK